MCSNTQWARRLGGDDLTRLQPVSVSEISSPGATSRISSAPMMSKAQLSEAIT